MDTIAGCVLLVISAGYISFVCYGLWRLWRIRKRL